MSHLPSSRAPGYLDLLQTPGALRFFIATLIGRIPLPMRPLGAILLIEQVTGSYGLAGAVGATTTFVAAVASPRLGALTDRYGDRPVLLWSLLAHIIGIVGLVLAVYAGLHPLVYFASATVIGLSTVPFPSLSRARWAGMLGRGPALEKAYALESIADEIGFIIGPIIVVPLAVSVAPSAGILAVIAFVGVASLVLALKPHDARHTVRTEGTRLAANAGSGTSIIANRGMLVLVSALFCLGLIFGAVELMMVAFAEDQGSPGAASYLVAIFAFGSMLSAIVVGSRSWATPPPRRFVIWSVLLTIGTIPILLANSIPFMAIAVFLTGIGIAPTMIAANSVVEGLAERNRLNEAFAWLSSAVASGVAIGSIIAGIVIDELGTRGGQAVGVFAGGLAAVVVVVGANTLQGRRQTRSVADRDPA
ncbi:MAG TPA: MFS transporter [Thermomicrobiales bacterium]|nr:MFS transporter [Thermomicrobiales bacterium]